MPLVFETFGRVSDGVDKLVKVLVRRVAEIVHYPSIRHPPIILEETNFYCFKSGECGIFHVRSKAHYHGYAASSGTSGL